jgi:hypothetical protein
VIQSTPEHNVGDQKMTYRMAANAIWNKLNFALSLIGQERHQRQLDEMIQEARALADSIVRDERSGDGGDWTEGLNFPDFPDIDKAMRELPADEFLAKCRHDLELCAANPGKQAEVVAMHVMDIMFDFEKERESRGTPG